MVIKVDEEMYCKIRKIKGSDDKDRIRKAMDYYSSGWWYRFLFFIKRTLTYIDDKDMMRPIPNNEVKQIIPNHVSKYRSPAPSSNNNLTREFKWSGKIIDNINRGIIIVNVEMTKIISHIIWIIVFIILTGI